jgi:hypothetical protein
MLATPPLARGGVCLVTPWIFAKEICIKTVKNRENRAYFHGYIDKIVKKEYDIGI